MRNIGPRVPPLILGLAMTSLLACAPPYARAQEAVRNPHGTLEVPCATCHAATGWTPAKIASGFDHADFGFPLEHAHSGLDCGDCHRDLEFANTERDCVACHLDVHLGELGIDCERCHSLNSFLDVARQRDLHRDARFALTGAHAGTDCESCHLPRGEGGLSYLGTSTECIDCHRAEYASTTDPDHVEGGFVDRCDACHGTATWVGGYFNHERQLGGSLGACVSCHRDDYDAATDPPHAGGSFPLECQICHDTRRWTGSFFAHDDQWFPIFTGRHAQEWNQCSECHKVSTDYTLHDCLGCHPHSDRNKTDGDHDGEDGYRYDSVACYDCHPRGR